MHKKEILAEFIYRLNQTDGFLCGSPAWSAPVTGFSHNKTLPSKFISELKKSKLLSEGTDAVICVLADWETVAEGIVFTDRALYVNSPKNKPDKKFKVRYDEITDLTYFSSEPELLIETSKDNYYIKTKMWSKRQIHDFLQFATKRYKFDWKHEEQINAIKLETVDNQEISAIAAGLAYANVSNASSLYFDDKLASPRGHGFAAENANHLMDYYSGKKAEIVGNDNAKDGADRRVNGVNIQSKYCASGSKCVQECFENGNFRYWNTDGTPMQIEVPSDMYESAIQAMESRIKRGEVQGVTDPAEAKNIIRKGHFTYAQAKNIAKAGTVESIAYDAASGAIIARNAFGITVVLTFATSLWSGEDVDIALKNAAAQGLKVGGTTFVAAVLAGQLSKAGLNSALVGSSEAIIRIMGPKASAALVNAFKSGTNIYGAAAMKSAAKLLRGNVITNAATFVVLSIGDVSNIFRGRISGAQLFKNLTSTASTVVGGGVGWTAGASAGASAGAAIGSIIPGTGTAAGAAIGGFIGGLAGAMGGGAAASKVTGAVLDQFIEDDADKMVAIIQSVFTELAAEYLVSQKEAEAIVENFKVKLTGATIKDMYASADRELYARELMEDYFKDMASGRKHIAMPTTDQMQKGLRTILEEISDSESFATV